MTQEEEDLKTIMLRALVGLPESKPTFDKMEEMADQIIARIPSHLIKEWQAMPGMEGWWASYNWLLDFFNITDPKEREDYINDAQHQLRERDRRREQLEELARDARVLRHEKRGLSWNSGRTRYLANRLTGRHPGRRDTG